MPSRGERIQNCGTATASVLLTMVATMFLPLVLPPTIAQLAGRTKAELLPLRIAESKADNEHSVTRSSCVLVMPDGQFHVESRRIAAPRTAATLTIYESSLDAAQIEELTSIINEAIPGLPAYEERPVGFTNAPWFSKVSVSVGEGAPRRFGYWSWDARNPGPMVDAQVKKRWLDTENGLRPLLSWFHQLDTRGLPKSDSNPTECFPE